MGCVMYILQTSKLSLREFLDLHELTKLVSVKLISQCLEHREYIICAYWINKSTSFCFLIQVDSIVHVTNILLYCLTLNCRVLSACWKLFPSGHQFWSPNCLPRESDPRRPPGPCVMSIDIFCVLQIRYRFLQEPKIKDMLVLTLCLRTSCSRDGGE